VQPEQSQQQSIPLSDYKSNFKQEYMEEKEPIRKNEDYIHKVMAPSFVTDQKHNVPFSKG
jgi:NAD+--asparagine ADP-ribosyltransferase